MNANAVQVAFIVLALVGCREAYPEARSIVANELGGPKVIEFRNLRAHATKDIVCGEVMASDQPDGGWRHFVAYPALGRAAVSPPGGVTAVGEMGNPVLAGAADEFNRACD